MVNKKARERADKILAASKAVNADDFTLRICELLIQFSSLSAKKRARLVSNLDDFFASLGEKIKQKDADVFEFDFYIFKQAQDVLNPENVGDGRNALSSIKKKIEERYPNIKSVYDSRRANPSFSEIMKMSRAEFDVIDSIFKKGEKTDEKS